MEAEVGMHCHCNMPFFLASENGLCFSIVCVARPIQNAGHCMARYNARDMTFAGFG